MRRLKKFLFGKSKTASCLGCITREMDPKLHALMELIDKNTVLAARREALTSNTPRGFQEDLGLFLGGKVRLTWMFDPLAKEE